MTEKRSGLTVPERFIPVPTSISLEAQAFLAHLPPPADNEPPPPVTDKAAWRARAAAADQGMMPIIAGYAQQYPAEVTTHQLSAAPLYELAPKNLTPENERRALLYVHGGGFFMGGGQAAIYAAMPLASLARVRTFSLDYRMPPDHPFPAALDDSIEAYRWLLQRYKPQNIAIYGPSAGGNLAPALILKARDLGLPLPAVCAVHSPAADLTESGDTFRTNAVIDAILQQPMPELMELYSNGHDRTDPLISPIFADYGAGFPPTILTTGTRDLLLSSAVLLHRALRRGGVEAELHVWEAMPHAPFFGSPEEHELYGETVRFILEHLDSD